MTVMPYLGAPWLPFWPGVVANSDELYLRTGFLLSLVFAPSFLPWSVIKEEEATFGWGPTAIRNQVSRWNAAILRQGVVRWSVLEVRPLANAAYRRDPAEATGQCARFIKPACS